MLELKNITKIYKSKKGVKTTALNNITLRFGNKGMVFVLGKSGSGKSTLLNIVGGLDKYNSGEIIINGKSSIKFKQHDFDAYRNTYVGFIFQEFNLLEEFSVHSNIALALQLQKKEPDKEKINNILKRVDLEGLGTRKPNELSGGQKQRVAIARALIKEPDIILADEPTGNLDSATSEQIFNLLKDLSKEKLVLVVSHDAESAKKYADRIVEFKDGIIISDVDNTNSYKNDEDFKLIKSHLPFIESFKLGFNSLKNKKIRLAFTILLTAAALTFLGISDTVKWFDSARSHVDLMKSNSEKRISFNNIVDYANYPFTDKIIADLKKETNLKLYNYYTFNNDISVTIGSFGFDQNKTGDYVYLDLYSNLSFVEISDNDVIVDELIGRLPLNEKEVVVSSYIADAMMKVGVNLGEVDEFGLVKTYQPTSYNQVISDGKTFKLANKIEVKIVGILNQDTTRFAELINKKSDDFDSLTNSERRLSSELMREVQLNYTKVYVVSDFISKLDIPFSYSINPHVVRDFTIGDNRVYAMIKSYTKDITFIDLTGAKTVDKLNNNEAVIGVQALGSMDGGFDYALQTYVDSHPTISKKEATINFIKNYLKVKDIIGMDVKLKIGVTKEVSKAYKVVGVELSDTFVGGGSYITYLPFDSLTDHWQNNLAVTGLIGVTDNYDQMLKIFKLYPEQTGIVVGTKFSGDILLLKQIYQVLARVGLYASYIFLTFSTFLISNFIVISINYRKKEIGILRAIGARGSDVLSIFIWEGMLIGSFALTIATFATIYVNNWLNNIISKELLSTLVANQFKALIFGIRQFGLLFVIIFGIVLLATLLPTLRISRMKPIDAILNK